MIDSKILWSILIPNVWKKNICLTLYFVLSSCWQKYIPANFWHSVKKHFWTILFIYCPDWSIVCGCYTIHIRKPMFCLHYTCKSILMKIINNKISVLLNNIFCLTEMFQQVRFLRFVVFQSVYFKITSDHSKWKKK